MSPNTTLNTVGRNHPGIGLDLASPVTVLPLVAALAVVVFTFFGGCIVYHRRQRKRNHDLVRQLRVTERRMDAIGMITTKKQQSLVVKKTDYCPPVAAPCSSNSTPGIANTNGNNPNLILSGEQQSGVNIANSTTDVCEEKKKTFTVTVQLNDINHNIIDDLETKLDTNDSSYYCSTFKVEESAGESEFDYCTDPFNSSLAAECATIPAVSSLSTVCSTNKGKGPSKVRHKFRKSNFVLHRKTLRDKLSKKSLRFIRGLGLESGTTPRLDRKQMPIPQQLCINIEAPKTNLDKATPIAATDDVMFTRSESSVFTVEEECNNGLILFGNNISPVEKSVADSCTTITVGKSEKWV